MITGHLGVAFGARARDGREAKSAAPLLFLLVAAFAPDGVDFLLAAGKYCNPEGVISHSIPAAALLALVLSAAAYAYTRSGQTALMVAVLVLLHLPADWITGLKTPWPGQPAIGFFVYRHGWLDFLVEAPVTIAGWWMLRRTNFTPRWVVSVAVLGALLAMQAAFDLQTTVSGTRPPRVCTNYLF